MENFNKKTYCVYIHTSPSGKKYVGITSKKPPEKRWANGHGYSHNSHFTNAINIYGWDYFQHEIIAEELSETDAMQMEKDLIAKYNTMNQNYGYNQTSGGEVDKEYTEEIKRKISNAAIQNSQNPERRKQLSEQAKKQWKNQEYKAKRAQMLKEQWQNEEYRNLVISKLKLQTGDKNPFYGKRHTNETKKQISIKNSNKQRTEKTCQKLSDARIKLWQNEEYRTKMTKQLQGENNPHYGKKHCDEAKNSIGEKNGIPVVQLDKNDNFIDEFRSAKMAENKTKINRTSISRCCRCQQQTAGGFKWMYKEDYNKLVVQEIDIWGDNIAI